MVSVKSSIDSLVKNKTWNFASEAVYDDHDTADDDRFIINDQNLTLIKLNQSVSLWNLQFTKYTTINLPSFFFLFHVRNDVKWQLIVIYKLIL